MYNNLGLLLVASSVDNSNLIQLNLQKAKDQKEFISQNSFFMVLAKDKVEHIFKDDEYYLSVLGLTTGQSYSKILVQESLYNNSYEGFIFSFQNSKEENFGLFKKLNENNGAMVLKKYDDKGKKYIRLYGLDNNTINVFTCTDDYYNKLLEGDIILKNSHQVENDEQPLEDTWYNFPCHSTFDVENIIDNSKMNDYLYVYFKDNNNIENIIITTVKPQDKHFITNLEQTLVIHDVEDTIEQGKEVSDTDAELASDIIKRGCVCMSVKALVDYPIQSRINLCNLINAIWALGVWFELGQYSMILKKLKERTDN